MRKVIVMMLLAVVSGSAAAEWVEVDAGTDRTFYVDPATIRKTGYIVKMWYLVDFKIIQSDVAIAPFLSSKDQSEYDCKEERLRTLYFTNHTGNMGRGNISFTSQAPLGWHPVAPGSVTEVLWKFACGKQ